MALPEETYRTELSKSEKAGGIAWLILVFAIHFLDLFTRYRTTTISFSSWTLFIVIYAIIALRFYRKWGDKWVILVCYILTAVVFPAIYPRLAPLLGDGLGAMLMVFNPLWVLYLLFAHTEYYPKISFAYMVFWIALLTFSFMPQVQLYAEEQGYGTAYSPAIAVRYMGSTVSKAYTSAKEGITKTGAEIGQEIERTKRTITGDYYTGEVDKGTEKPLGVFLRPLQSTQPTFYTGQPATVFTTLKAETIAEPIDITLTCRADGQRADKIIPQTQFRVETLEEQSIDCMFSNLAAGSYTFKLTADFTFTTRAYQLVYTMNQNRLREDRRQNKDPLEGFPNKNPATQYTSGPVMIGIGGDIGTGKQPLGIPDTQGPGPTAGVTIDNVWTGKLKEIEHILMITPKAIEITDINGIEAVHVEECSLLPTQEDAERCDIERENYYYVPQEEITRVNKEKDIVAYTFRAHTRITDPQLLTGPEPQQSLFKVTARYRYSYAATKSLKVEERKAPAETTPPTL